ncbi:FAD:protein FMN transferase [bacterium]|nr:FAD:protein FMN transferase [candidate division CSSED10-310 bacterium]
MNNPSPGPVSRLASVTVIFLLCLVSMTGCRSERLSRSFYAMGGIPVTITVTGMRAPLLQELTGRAQISVEEWESELSMYRPGSAVNQLMKQKNRPVTFSPRGWEALSAARNAERITNHAFDITVGPIIRLWKSSARENRMPTPEQIRDALRISGFEHLIFNEEQQTVTAGEFAEDPDVSEIDTDDVIIDVGGIAKGLFAEWICKDILAGLPASDAKELRKLTVDVGGDVYVHSFSDKNPCEIGIRNPFSPNPSDLWGKVGLLEGAIVTSGTYERAFEINGHRYCHIVNPQTGYPVETNLVSVTIIDPSGAMADALATSVFVMGENKARELIDSRSGTDMLIIRNDGSYYCSPGICESLEIFQIEQTAQ